jgi:hypothetical protein
MGRTDYEDEKEPLDLIAPPTSKFIIDFLTYPSSCCLFTNIAESTLGYRKYCPFVYTHLAYSLAPI